MDTLLPMAVSNGVVAFFLAAVAAAASRFRVNPAVTHVLWLLVLLKLFTPPIVSIGVPLPGVTSLHGDAVDAVRDNQGPRTHPAAHGADAAMSVRASSRISWQQLLLAVWIAGGVLVAAWQAARIVGIGRLLRHAAPAPDFLSDLAAPHCRRLGISRCPEILALPVQMTPAVWSLGGCPRILLPSGLIEEMDRDRLETLLVHELAHVRRRDHLVRLVELTATIVFWWHPVVWLARIQLRELEERACDALVLRTVAHGPRTYAMALVETLEFLNSQPGPLPIVATAVSPTVSLQRRIEMMKSGPRHAATLGAVLSGMVICLPAMMVALAAEPPQAQEKVHRGPEAEGAGTRVLVRVSDDDDAEPRLWLFGDPEDAGIRGKVLIRLREDGEGEWRLFRDPEDADARGKMIIRIREDGDAEPKLWLIRDPEDAEARGKVIIRIREDGDAEGVRWLFRDPEKAGPGKRKRVIIREVAPEE